MTDLTFANYGRKTVFLVPFASIVKPNVQLQSSDSLIFHVLKAIKAISEYKIVTSNPYCPVLPEVFYAQTYSQTTSGLLPPQTQCAAVRMNSAFRRLEPQ